MSWLNDDWKLAARAELKDGCRDTEAAQPESLWPQEQTGSGEWKVEN